MEKQIAALLTTSLTGRRLARKQSFPVASFAEMKLPHVEPDADTAPCEADSLAFVADADVVFGENDLSILNPMAFNKTVLFRESDHKYALVDAQGRVFTKHMVSGSKLMDVTSGKQEDEEEEEIPDVVCHMVRKRFLANLDRYLTNVQGYRLPMTFKERLSAFDGAENVAKATMLLLPTSVYETIEHCVFNKTDVQFETWEDLTLFKKAAGDRTPLARSVRREGPPLPWYDAGDVRGAWRTWADQGTRLHAHLEARLNGLSREEAVERGFTMEEETDYEQVEQFLEENASLQVVRTELRLGSFRHMICGMLDLLVWDEETQLFEIHDFKRSKNVFNGRATKKYLEQMTIYSRLLRMAGYPVSRKAVLHVFHPSMARYQRKILYVDDDVEKRVARAFAIRESVVAKNP